MTADNPHAAYTLAQLVPALHLQAEHLDHLATVAEAEHHPKVAQAHRDDAARIRAALALAGV